MARDQQDLLVPRGFVPRREGVEFEPTRLARHVGPCGAKGKGVSQGKAGFGRRGPRDVQFLTKEPSQASYCKMLEVPPDET